MEKTLGINEQCFIRSQSCGRAYGGSRLCFIACPSADEVQLEIGVIKSVLRDNNIEPYVAIDNFEPGKDIFCEKICAKIIESQFCTVLLSDIHIPDISRLIPNPNVYYEYGLMVAMHKTVLPLQKQDATLAFNIQSLDTLPYNQKNLRGVFQVALKSVVGKSSTLTKLTNQRDYIHIFKKLSELENQRFYTKEGLPDPWSSILADTVFDLRQGPTFVADFTSAWTTNTVISEIRILLNHLSNEVSILQDNISKSDSNVITPVPIQRNYSVSFPVIQPSYTPETFLYAKGKAEYEQDLDSIKSSKIMVILPDRWTSDVENKYSQLDHPQRLPLVILKESQLVTKAIEAGLLPGQST
jgi:hypothetical protein